MIIESKDINTKSNQETVDFQINNEDGHLFNVLSELYSDPVGSTIREIGTNCCDAHIMSNNEERPFVIKLPNPEENINEIAFRDYGPGLSHKEVLDIYRIYGKSTKNKNKDVTGCLGLGSKSPYSISSTFYVKSYLNGKVYLYTCAMNNNGKPNITENPIEMDTTEENGLEVIIPFYRQVNFEEILKKTFKYFKVKPLIYKQRGNLDEDIRINIDWLKLDEMFQLTDSIYINRQLLSQPAYLNNKLTPIVPEVIQLQIYYPIDTEMIMNTIDRFNKAFISLDGSINNKYQISPARIKIIKFILKYGIKIYSVSGKIAFSPSRETIKYTDSTVEYLITELNQAAKYIEKIIFKNFNSLTNSFESFYEKMILNHDKYTQYLELCKNFNINRKMQKNFDEYEKLVYEISNPFKFIIGKFPKNKENYKEYEFIKNIKQFWYKSNHGIRENHIKMDRKIVTQIDLFNKDILKKIPNLKENNINLVTAIMSDNFKNRLESHLNDILKELQNEIAESHLNTFNDFYKMYFDGKFTYLEFLEIGSFCTYPFNIDFTLPIEEELERIRTGIKDKYLTDGNFINHDLIFLETNIKRIYTQFEKTLPEINYLVYIYKLVNIYSKINLFVKNLFIIEDETNLKNVEFLYYLSKFMHTYMDRKNKIKEFENNNLFVTFNMGKMYNFTANKHTITDSDYYEMEKKIIMSKDFMKRNDDRFISDFSIAKLKPSLLTYLCIEVTKRLLQFDLPIVQEQLSLNNHDLTIFIKKDLASVNIKNAENKIIDRLATYTNKVSSQRTQKLNLYKNPEKLSTQTSEFLLLDYSKEDCIEMFDYLKLLIKYWVKIYTVNRVFEVVNFSTPYKFTLTNGYNDSEWPEKLVCGRNNLNINGKIISIPDKMDKYKDKKIFGEANVPFERNKGLIYPKLNTLNKFFDLSLDILNLEFSIENYNKVFSFTHSLTSNFNILTGIPEYDKFINSFAKVRRENSITMGNKIIHKLPTNYNFEKLFINNATNTGSTTIDQVEFLNIVNYIKDKKIFVVPTKYSPRLNVKTMKNVPGFNIDANFDFEHLNIFVKSDSPYITANLKKLMDCYDTEKYYQLLGLYAKWFDQNLSDYIIINSNSLYSDYVKKSVYNIYQLVFITNFENVKKYFTSNMDLYLVTNYDNLKARNFLNEVNYKSFDYHFINEIFNSSRMNFVRYHYVNFMVEKLKNYDGFDERIAKRFSEYDSKITNNFLNIFMRIHFDFEMYFKFMLYKFPKEFVDPKVFKDLKNAFEFDRNQFIEAAKKYYGIELIDKIISFDFKLLANVDFYDMEKIFYDVFEDEILLLSFYSDINKHIEYIDSFLSRKNKDIEVNEDGSIKQVKVSDVNIVKNYSPETLENLRWLGRFYNNIDENKLYRTIFNKLFIMDKDKKNISQNELLYNKANLIFRKISNHKINKELSKLFFIKTIHDKINTKTYIEKNKNKNIKRIPENRKKYFPL